MTYVRFGGSDIDPGMVIGIVLGTMIVLLIIVIILRKRDDTKDDSKPLLTAKVRILEKTVDQSDHYHKNGYASYVVETNLGERMQLRSLNANSLILTVGDTGIATFRGETLESFKVIPDSEFNE